MQDNEAPFIHLAKWLALVTALLISLGIPLAYLYFGYQREVGRISAEIEFKAYQISQLIRSNPEYWQFEDHRVHAVLVYETSNKNICFQRVVDMNGDVVAQNTPEEPAFSWLSLKRHKKLLDYGTPVGQIEITRSMQDLFNRSTLIGSISILAGLLVYWGLRVLPLNALQRAWDRASYLASHDDLTGLPGRIPFLDRLEYALGMCNQGTAVTVFVLDLDRFKDINDTFGHAAGDTLLKLAAQRTGECLQEGDTLARLSGDEFAIIQARTDRPETAAALAKNIVSELSQPFDLNGHEAIIGVSIGMAMNTEDNPVAPDQLLKYADLALYKSKNEGRGSFHFFREDMDAELQARKSLESDIRKAFRDEQFELYYQPQVDLTTQRILGLEALLRWHHPERGYVPPMEVIPIAETIGLIGPLCEWILRTACREAMSWPSIRIAVNLSPSLFQQQGLVPMVERALKDTGLPPYRLELEITEEILISDTNRTLSVLNELKNLGVQIAMDDFGTGYSSLSYLRQFPFDKIKIDRSFIADVDKNMEAKAIVRAIIGMSHALKIHTNAEGVETIEQANILMEEGCEEVQGYLYGRPMRRKDIEMLIGRSNAAAEPAETLGSLPSVA